MILTDDRHPAKCLARMEELRKSGRLCDVVIEADEHEFRAHRVVLAGCSPYFTAMFTSDLEESKHRVVAIRDISAPTMALLIDYCYSSEIELTEDNVQYLLSAASILQLVWVRDVCCDFMKQHMEPSNCLGIRVFADAHSCSELFALADSYAQEHYQQVVQSQEFLELDGRDLAGLIQSEELNVRNEEQVFESVMQWVNFNSESRKKELPDILKYVRLPLLERNYLVSKVGTESLIRQNEECRDLLDKVKDYLLLPDNNTAATLESHLTKPRMPSKRREVLFAVGGWCNGDAINTVECYSVQDNAWKSVAPMSKRRCGVGVAVLGDTLYAIGGHDGTNYLSSVECYNTRTDQWSGSVVPMSCCRTSVGVAVLNGYIYAIGGQNGVSCLNLVERYDPSKNQWCSVTPMNTIRLGVAVAVIGGHLYAVGGSDGSTPLATVERYDPKCDRWTMTAPMLIRRKHLGVAVLENVIYAAGGRDETSELDSVERFDPVTNTWEQVMCMKSRRSGVGLNVVSGRLFAVGGFDGATYLKTAECFDPVPQDWKVVAMMNDRRLGCGVVTITLTHAS